MEEDSMIRCFVALDFPREVIGEIERIQDEIGKKNIMIGKFTEGENLHLTLKFLGGVSENRLEEIRDKLDEVDFGVFDASIGDLGVFSSNFIRVVWNKILGKGVFDLQKIVDEKLSEIGFEKEHRFMGHLTIARVKNLKDRKLFLEELKKIKVRKINFRVDRFYLIKSELKPEGPEYTVLKEYLLNGRC